LRKEPKLYLWDWSQVSDEGARLENMVASHFLKLSHFFYDTEGLKINLNFLRDQDGHEVDLLLSLGQKPLIAVEVKNKDTQISKHLKYFQKKLAIPYSYQVVGQKDVDFKQDGVRVISADKFLGGII
jgi:hypothetical protein